jgi:predicted alpha/beta-fold hydrolase
MSQTTFRAAPWVPGRHLQTVFGPLLRKPVPLPLTRERWELPDGDFLDVDRFAPGSARRAPTLLVLHGLEGSGETFYSRGLLAEAHQRGWGGAVLNFRSCSGESNRLCRSYHSGETGDAAFAIRRLVAERPGAPLLVAGVSLGGNVLVKWLGEQGEQVPRELRAAAALSVPFDLALCARALDGPGFWAWAYRRRFLKTLLAKAREKSDRFPEQLPAVRLRGIRTLREFDDRVTAKVHGFTSADDYYTRCSSGPFLPAVRVPLLLLQAVDDPFVPPAALPTLAAAQNPRLTFELHPHGGHVGFVAGPPWRPRYYAERRIGAWLAEQLG